ncbi:PAS domain S-box protein [Guyparkeria sp. GHLCS8-2]|uniref:PAS domain S-box protein n=1 Tax=Guyparkeria halopsychrophila TaxID=3139421 RepID=UPI0037C9C6E9
MIRRAPIVSLLLGLLLWTGAAQALIAEDEVLVGVFGMRPAPIMEQRFQPLIDYLNDSVDGVTFRLKVLPPDQLDHAIRRNQVDLLLTNPTHYITVRSENALSGVLATLVARNYGETTRSLGGVIITRKDKTGIETLADLAGPTIAAPGTRFLGGYRAPLFEAFDAGIDLREQATFEFVGTHDAVVEAVLNGKADVGFIRTGVLENLRSLGAAHLDELRVVNKQPVGSFPFVVSTRLYPEWPMVTMQHMDADLERRIGAALFSLDTSDPAAMLSGIAGFGPPGDYASVEEISRRLSLPPFDTPPDITAADIWAQYWMLVVVVVVAVLLITVLSLALLMRHHALRRSEERFRRFFEDNASVMLLIDFERCKIIDANQAAVNFYGWPRDMLEGRPIADLWATHCRHYAETRDVDTTAGYSHLHTHRLRSGEERRVEVHVTPLHDKPDGGQMFVIVHDITERERAEKALERERERLNNVIEGTNVGTWEWNIQTGETVLNERWAEMIGYRLDELQPTTLETWNRFVHPDDLEASNRMLQACFRHERDYFEAEVRMRHRDGHWPWILTRGRVLEWTDDGQPLRMWGTHQDITSRKRMEQDLQLAASVFVHAREAIMITGLDARIIDVNAAFTEMTGWRRYEVIGHTPKFLQSGLQDAEFYRQMRERLRTAGYWSGELWNRHKNGELFAERLTISLVRDAEGNPSSYIALASDITDVKNYQKELEHRASHDALTGLPNRVLMSDRLRQNMAAVRRRGGMLAVVFLDLDGFKAVNDEHGHDMGDKLLIEMAQDLGAQLRELDTLARISGDEFVILLGGLTQEMDAQPIIERLIEAAAKERIIDGVPIQVTASLGYTYYPQTNGIDDETLIKQADSAMYEAKEAGRNRACRYRLE